MNLSGNGRPGMQPGRRLPSRGTIVKAASARVARQGTSAATCTNVAADIGVPERSVRRLVGDDDRLQRLVLEQTSAHEPSLVRAAASLEGPAAERLVLLVGAALTRIGDPGVRNDFLVELEAALAFARSDGLEPVPDRARHHALVDELEALCAAAGESALGVSARGMAATLLAVIEGFWLLTLADDMQDDLGEVPRTIVLLLRALDVTESP